MITVLADEETINYVYGCLVSVKSTFPDGALKIEYAITDPESDKHFILKPLRLGDLHLMKTSIGRFAFENAIQGFRNDLIRILVNFTTTIKTAEALAKDEVPNYRGGLINP